ncbi:hypothetical protein BDA96_04G184100 [Sorghum bicolor]|uniref:Uncharacterized protein n=1 Tax=Sorghum bicolor TaxID=4558 RepID=A0A921R5B1_SORBI|nr:hypothetical protein BDA96_04G184100 [Sorghum bicolor]
MHVWRETARAVPFLFPSGNFSAAYLLEPRRRRSLSDPTDCTRRGPAPGALRGAVGLARRFDLPPPVGRRLPPCRRPASRAFLRRPQRSPHSRLSSRSHTPSCLQAEAGRSPCSDNDVQTDVHAAHDGIQGDYTLFTHIMQPRVFDACFSFGVSTSTSNDGGSP